MRESNHHNWVGTAVATLSRHEDAEGREGEGLVWGLLAGKGRGPLKEPRA